MKTNLIYQLSALGLAILFMACQATENLTSVGNPINNAAEVSISFDNDIENSISESVRAVTISTGSTCRSGSGSCYTPDTYILGIRQCGLIHCEDSTGVDMPCPGFTGEEVEENLLPSESYSVFTLNTTVTDHIIYEDALANPIVGDSSDYNTDPITDAGLYSGLQFGLDFVMTQYPTDDASVHPGSGVNGEEFVLFCMNENGCSGLTGYVSDYDGLADGSVENGDIVFLDASTGTWSYWDLDTETFSPIAGGRPVNILTQNSVSGHPRGTDGEVLYNASFGSLPSLNITTTDIANGNTEEIVVIFTVDEAMSFVDVNTNGIVDPEDLATLEFGKFHMNGIDVMAETFN